MVTFPIFPLRGGPEMLAKWANQFKNSVEETAAVVEQNVVDVTGLENDNTDIKAQNYIVVSASTTLTAERSLAAEPGVLTLTDAGAGSTLTVGLAVNGVTFGKIQQIDAPRLLGRTTAGTGDIEPLTGTQATALLDAFTGDSGAGGLKGSVPAPASGDAAANKYLKADGVWTAIPTLDHGTYTPTLTGTLNVDAVTAFDCQYTRVGDTVTVSGKMNVTATSTGATWVAISLPIASNFASENQCAGVGSATAVAQSGGVRADGTNDRAELRYDAIDTSNRTMMFHFTYRII